jgi:hypothetical protein
LNQCGINREMSMLADCEIRLNVAMTNQDAKAVEIYERIIRLLRS